jgi:hypothetical protein
VISAPPSYGVLCGTGTGLAVGATVALALRRDARSPTALVLHWAAGHREVSPRAPARPGARRLAASLREGGHRAWASGRLVFVALPDDPVDAEAAAGRAAGAAGRAPCVLVVAGPRPSAIESMLELQDGIVIVPPAQDAAELSALAASSLAATGLVPSVLAPAASAVARMGAVTGLWLAPRSRRSLAAALGDRW